MNTSTQDMGSVLSAVAEAVKLQEGVAGVRAVLKAYRDIGPAATREVSRRTSIPVPIVAAIANELRRHGLLGEQRPSALTSAGLDVVNELGATVDIQAECRNCSGLEITIPRPLNVAVERMANIMSRAPKVDLSLDQSFCTAATKVRRVLALIRAGVLPGGSVLLIGDDDLISLAIGVVGQALNTVLSPRIGVVDISSDMLNFISDEAGELNLGLDLAQHDLREPLPQRLRGQFDAAMTDPPYTPEGARLFLSRAVEGVRPGPAQSVFFSFGAKGPAEMLDVQRQILELGLVTNGFVRNFNEYLGSGILAGTGSLQHLLTTEGFAAAVHGSYAGPMYTRDKRTRARQYFCAECETRVLVGVGAPWESLAALQESGCPNCGKTTFRPGELERQ